MREVKEVDIYLDGERVLENVTLNYEAFDMASEEPQVITATAFFPTEERYNEGLVLVIDFKDGVFAKVEIFARDRLGDEYLCDMRFIDAGYSLEEMS